MSRQSILSFLALLAVATMAATDEHNFLIDYYDQETYYDGDDQAISSNGYDTYEPSSYLSLGDKCHPANDDCGYDVQCRKTTFCPDDRPVCQCLPGYVGDVERNMCKLQVKIGQFCNSSGLHCEAPNSYCNSQGLCACLPDYKPGPAGDCVHAWRTRFYGQECRKSIQCHYNLTCDNFICSCPIGSRVDVATNSFCILNQIGDTCVNDDDCFRKDTVCEDGRCACDYDFTLMSLRFHSVDAPAHQICVQNRIRRRRAGQGCSMTYPFFDGVCNSGLVCSTQCGEPLCIDPKDNSMPTSTPDTATTARNTVEFWWGEPLYGDECESNFDCATLDGSLACRKPWSKTCSFDSEIGTCGCADDFFLNGTSKCVRKPAGSYLGQQCLIYAKNDLKGSCVPDNSVCSNGRCICKLGWKPGPRGDDCVSNWKTQYYGEECHDPVQCHYNMVCVNESCSCLGVGVPGKPLVPGGGIVECSLVNAGDRCLTPADCSGLTNSHCSDISKRCECQPGYRTTTLHLGKPDDVTVWCLPTPGAISEPQSPFRRRQEGEECNFQQPEEAAYMFGRRLSAQLTVMPCAQSLYCAKCADGSDKAICLSRNGIGDSDQQPTTREATTRRRRKKTTTIIFQDAPTSLKPLNDSKGTTPTIEPFFYDDATTEAMTDSPRVPLRSEDRYESGDTAFAAASQQLTGIRAVAVSINTKSTLTFKLVISISALLLK